MSCVNCGNTDTNWYPNEDGHYLQECPECDHVGGPYVSETEQKSSNDIEAAEEPSDVEPKIDTRNYDTSSISDWT